MGGNQTSKIARIRWYPPLESFSTCCRNRFRVFYFTMKETVVTQTYDLLAYLTPLLAKFPRTQKFVLADRIQQQLTDILMLFIEGYYAKTNAKRPILEKANLELEKLRYLIRLAKDLRCMDLRRYEFIQEKINAIGSQTGGWLKSLP